MRAEAIPECDYWSLTLGICTVSMCGHLNVVYVSILSAACACANGTIAYLVTDTVNIVVIDEDSGGVW